MMLYNVYDWSRLSEDLGKLHLEHKDKENFKDFCYCLINLNTTGIKYPVIEYCKNYTYYGDNCFVAYWGDKYSAFAELIFSEDCGYDLRIELENGIEYVQPLDRDFNNIFLERLKQA